MLLHNQLIKTKYPQILGRGGSSKKKKKRLRGTKAIAKSAHEKPTVRGLV